MSNIYLIGGFFVIKRLILVFFILTFSIGIACAGDNNATAGDFDELNTQITQADKMLYLQKDYHSTNTSNQIIIDKEITIDGNMHNISAPDVERVFLVKADNVCIKNINFINSNTNGLSGGVISWWGNNGSLINCTFTNNSASSGGGALLWKGDYGLISNCVFSNNSVNYGVATSLNDGEGFDKSVIHIQIVESDGGALYVSGNNLLIDNCDFTNNTALLNGGAISVDWSRNLIIKNSRFKNNKASYHGGAIEINGEDITLINIISKNNTPNDLFNNCLNTKVFNSTFNTINSFYDVRYVAYFDELSELINNTLPGTILVLDKDYEYLNGSNKGISISKPITIDGNGHILDGNGLSRIFNITSDNVTLKNIRFINGNAFGRYFTTYIGGGAIYWNGNNGYLENCNFTNNHGWGIEDDPFENPKSYIEEDGTIREVFIVRPMGARTNEGGAIVWNGTNGTIFKCEFRNNSVGYPNCGGAIFWRGSNGKIISSIFMDNGAWTGAAVAWLGENGLIDSSRFLNSGLADNGIHWFGEGGVINNSILLSKDMRNVVNYYSESLNADNNFWGDTVENPMAKSKPANVKIWYLCKNNKFVDNFLNLNLNSKLFTLINSSHVFNIKITSQDLKIYYKSSKMFKVRVFDNYGKAVSGKIVSFKINGKVYNVKTDKKGYAGLKINQKPGTYTITAQYGDVKVKNKITVKTTLITKNVIKKVKKSAKFKVKLLNSKGKVLKNKIIKIRFNSKNYKIKTNKNGIASFSLAKNLKVGKYSIKTTYGSLSNSNKIIVKK